VSWFIITGSFACGMAFHNTNLQVSGLMAVMGVVSILFIQALVSVAILNYFRTQHAADHHRWTTITAPLISAVGLAFVLYLAIKNLSFLGPGYSYAKWLCWGDVLIFLVGLGYAFYLKSNDRAKYETVGRMINQGQDEV
jgi:hypothetical protein